MFGFVRVETKSKAYTSSEYFICYAVLGNIFHLRRMLRVVAGFVSAAIMPFLISLLGCSRKRFGPFPALHPTRFGKVCDWVEPRKR